MEIPAYFAYPSAMRRLHVQAVHQGIVELAATDSHHARDVLRMNIDDKVEVFDASGNSGVGTIVALSPVVLVEVAQLIEKIGTTSNIIVYSAVPKGDRADWLVEKLSELGVNRWVPLQTSRSVVHPDGASKYDRWKRIATESAKQCHRVGVMEIATLATLASAIADASGAVFLSTVAGSNPLLKVLPQTANPLKLFVGPEGGWTTDEEKQMQQQGLTPASLGGTILRIETAAVAASAIAVGFDQSKSAENTK